jgi:hypothetical protein
MSPDYAAGCGGTGLSTDGVRIMAPGLMRSRAGAAPAAGQKRAQAGARPA